MQDGGFIGYPTGWLFAVADDAATAATCLDAVRRVAPDATATIMEGPDAAAQFDGLGRRSGRMAWWRRMMQQLAMDQMPDFLWYEEALRGGRRVIAVYAPQSALRRKVADALLAAGAHFINYFGRWTTEAISPWRGEEPNVPQIMRR
ncbi:MAG TPA: hypothetical protein VF114_08165 [Candidatus Limnocylindria bacterium]